MIENIAYFEKKNFSFAGKNVPAELQKFLIGSKENFSGNFTVRVVNGNTKSISVFDTIVKNNVLLSCIRAQNTEKNTRCKNTEKTYVDFSQNPMEVIWEMAETTWKISFMDEKSNIAILQNIAIKGLRYTIGLNIILDLCKDFSTEIDVDFSIA